VKVTEVAVKIGELQNIELDVFKQALDDMAEFCKPR
jgi:Zn finger protein HypA/HybF involved in hydrogenase expression